MLDHLVVQSLQEQTWAIVAVRTALSIRNILWILQNRLHDDVLLLDHTVWTERENNDSTTAGRDGFLLSEAVVQ
jgi:hypothetical protein